MMNKLWENHEKRTDTIKNKKGGFYNKNLSVSSIVGQIKHIANIDNFY